MDIGAWLRSLGLEQYEAVFRAHAIDPEVLLDLSEPDLEKLGILLGHRKKLIKAIAALPPALSSQTSYHPGLKKVVSDAERRQLTVMFCDLVGSTQMAGRLELEVLREIIEAYQAGVRAEVTRYGGFVAKYMGDGVLVYFGYPQAHEDDAERAVRSGLSLLAVVPALCPHGEVLQVRVGIATGEVVVGNLIGAGSAQEQAVVGETPNLAARLQNLAGPGQVVIAPETRRLVGNLFQMTELGVVEAKGFTAPVCAWRVTGESRTESRFEAFHSGELTPLVGRHDELDLIRRRWAQARTGEGQAVLLSGEAGLGKSRLVVATEEMLAGEAPLRLRYFCSPHHQDIALFPVIQQLERAAKFEREDDGPTRLDKLRALLAPDTDREGFALVAELLSAPTEALNLPQGLSPQKKRERLLTALIHQLEHLARTAPVLIIWEDVHWIDPFSRDLINLTLDRILQLPMLMLVTFRPEFQASWVGREHVTMLALKRLSRRERNEMVGWLTGGKSLPAEVQEQIVKRTDGVPLFVEELTTSVLESGIVREEDARFVLSGALPTLAIPTTLQGSLLARLDRLAPLGEVAQIGAAIGREFSFELLAAVSGQSEEMLRQGLEQLTSAELVFARGDPPEVSYTFKHALVQDAAYATLLKSRRQELHGTIARVLEERFPEMVDRQPAVLAHHFEQAGLFERSVEYRLKAGQRAFERWSMEEAITQIQKGLHLAPMLPDDRERNRKELDLLLILGKALIATKGYSSLESRGAYDRARTLCENLDDSTTLMAVLNRLGAHFVMRGDLDVALEGGVKLFEKAQCDGSSRALAIAHARMSLILGPMGRLPHARAHANEALKLFGVSAGFRDTFSLNALVDIQPTVSAMLAATLCCLGHPDQALDLSESMIAEAQEKPNDAALAQGLWHLCHVYVLRRDIAGTLKISNHVTNLSNAKGLDWNSTSIILAGWARAQHGAAHDALHEISAALKSFIDRQHGLYLPWNLALLAEVYMLAGDSAGALATVEEGLFVVSKHDQRLYLSELLRLKSELAMLQSNYEEANSCLREALEVARSQDAKLLELRAALSLARYDEKQGQLIEAYRVLKPIYDWFTEGLETPDLQEARVMIEVLPHC